MVKTLLQQILPIEHLMHGSRAGGFKSARQLGTNGNTTFLSFSFPYVILDMPNCKTHRAVCENAMID